MEAALGRERERLNEAWQDMMLATRDRKLLEGFFEKCRRAHSLEVQREEQKTLDELGARRAGAAGVGAGLASAQLEFA